MPRPRIVMRKIREVLRLRLGEGLTLRTVAAVSGLPYTTVSDHVARAVRCGFGWPLPDGVDDNELEKKLFAREPSPPKETRPVPDWGWVRKQLSRVGVTLMLLWVEFKELHPDTYEYTQFVRYYRQWEQRCDLVMRQEHRAGQKLFVDFAGKKAIQIRNPATGVITLAELFVAVMGASNYIYAEAMPSQELPFWIQGHINCFEYMGACPELAVCDNLWSAVSKSHRYEPNINATFEEMGAHYRVAILPARARKPPGTIPAQAERQLREGGRRTRRHAQPTHGLDHPDPALPRLALRDLPRAPGRALHPRRFQRRGLLPRVR